MLETNSIAPSGQGVKPSPVQMLRVNKLKGGNIIKNATRHNLREIQAEQGADSHIDPLKIPNNVILRGESTAQAVHQQAIELMEQEGIVIKSLRHDTVRGIELLVSLPPDSGIPEREFFEASLAWAESHFELPVLSAVIHNDEAAPHCHIILLPLFDGRMLGSAKVGYQSHFAAILTAFYENVGKVFGLAKPAPRVVYSRVMRQKMAGMVVDYLKRNPRCLEQPAVCDALRDTFTENPLPMMTVLNLTVPETMREKTAVNALREPVKPRAKQNVKPIGFEVEQTGQKVQSLSCVGFVHRDASNQAMPTAVNHPVKVVERHDTITPNDPVMVVRDNTAMDSEAFEGDSIVDPEFQTVN
ncbi:MAG: plasmid recombination protein [Gallionella sp.]|nr:plasmid recombination protein [Gallionella sp.]